MPVGTSDTIVILSTKTEVHNLNTTITSAAQKDDSSPTNLQGNPTENRQISVTFAKDLIFL